MNRKIVMGIVIVVLIVVGIMAATKKSTTTESRIVKVGYIPVISNHPFYIAQANKYFEEANINIEPVAFQTSNQVAEALIRGDIDITAGISMVPVLTANQIDPGKTKIIYETDLTVDKPHDSIVTLKESGIKALSDLEGKKVGVLPGSTQKSILKKYLSDKKVDVSKVNIVELPPQNQVTALEARSIDALLALEPNKTFVLERGGIRLNQSTFAEFHNHSPIAAGIISQAFVDRDPKLAQKIIDIFLQANTFLIENETQSREIIGAAMKLDKNVSDKIVINEYRKPDATSTQEFIDLMFSIGELTSKPEVSAILYRE